MKAVVTRRDLNTDYILYVATLLSDEINRGIPNVFPRRSILAIFMDTPCIT